MKIVLDTNVFISGIFWSGPPNKVLILWAKNKIKLLVTKKILSEYFRVLQAIGKKGNITGKWSNLVHKNSLIIEDEELVQVCRDVEDNKFLDCAIAGKANYLVSGDKDLLSLKTIKSTKIITPTQFLKEYENLH